MKPAMTWTEVKATLAASKIDNFGDYRINEQIFAALEKIDWPLWGPYVDQFEQSETNYTGNASTAIKAITEAFGTWDTPYEANIDLQMRDGNWTARMRVEAGNVSAITSGDLDAGMSGHGSDPNIAVALMKACADIRCAIETILDKDRNSKTEPGEHGP